MMEIMETDNDSPMYFILPKMGSFCSVCWLLSEHKACALPEEHNHEEEEVVYI